MFRPSSQMVTVYQPDTKWLTDNVQSAADLLLVCDDGRVPVHSALLAGSSQLVASLLADHRTCSGCREPLNVHLVGTTTADCNMLVSLLYTGLAPLRGPGVDHVLCLAAMLGLELPGLQVQNADASLLVCGLPTLQYQVPPSVSRVRPTIQQKALPLSVPSFPSKEPTPASLLSTELREIPGTSKAADGNAGTHSLVQGIVELPNGILDEVLRVKSSIKLEVEDEFDPLEENWMEVEDEFNPLDENWMANCPRLEGNEQESKNGSRLLCVTPRLSQNSDASASDKDPKRNFVCKRCNAGFRFARSYRWHREKCRVEKKAVVTEGTQKKVKHCKICGKSFVGKSLKMHYINFHFKQKIETDYLVSGDESRKCPICKTKFKKIQCLITHIGYVHKAYLKYLREHDRLMNAVNALKGRKVSCGECTKCKMDNCGRCACCQDKPEFGGQGKLMKVCVRKVCRNKRVSEAVIKPTLVRKNFIDKKR